MNVKETLLEQQATIDRIETLKEEMHNLSKFGLGLSETDLFPINSATKASLSTMHLLSHVIEDVLDGADPKQAFKQAFTL
ncbi:hypothetical protein [Streptococcus gallolyticus]|uniref:hypothetical protein n=1 Tax=Streptococcus gallolyticus TaxID=315405 RepID=UPI00201A4606|nr:hypothetical protein [Streptococcus gallolyticus]MCL4890679.1 hypothetical protein [Streptococcus gallolyticus]